MPKIICKTFVFAEKYATIKAHQITMKIQEIKRKLTPIFKKHNVVLAYLFGSQANGKAGPLSDIDIAVVFKKKISEDNQFDLVLSLMTDIGRACEINKVDVINLNTVKEPLIRHNAVFSGTLIFDDKSRMLRFLTERSIMQEYEDTNYMREASSQILHQQIKAGLFGMAKV